MERQRDLGEFERRTRRLPHHEVAGATYFITFALRRPPAANLATPEIAPVIIASLRHHDGSRYWLYDYTVMPDHVHAILKPVVVEEKTEHLWRITKNLKSWTARRANEVLGRSGPFWESETYDHLIRNRADYEECAHYILRNPHTAGLIADPADWPWWGKGSGP